MIRCSLEQRIKSASLVICIVGRFLVCRRVVTLIGYRTSHIDPKMNYDRGNKS